MLKAKRDQKIGRLTSTHPYNLGSNEIVQLCCPKRLMTKIRDLRHHHTETEQTYEIRGYQRDFQSGAVLLELQNLTTGACQNSATSEVR